jgi:SRSO17 transposase
VVISSQLASELAAIEQWPDELEVLLERTASRFRRAEVRERVRHYLMGLLSRVERKNGWQLAEAIGETGPQGAQRLLNAAAWDAEAVRDDLRDYVVEHLADASSGVLIVDETGFVKKGSKSCGVARQYVGTAGAIVNAQVGVFLAYASSKGAAFIDRALYLPRAWTDDYGRRTEAGIPTTTSFRSKIELAEQLLARAFDAGVPARWVIADAGYGRSHAFRRWLEERDRAYVVMVPNSNAVAVGGRRQTVEKLGVQVSEEDWTTFTAPAGASDQAWACIPLSEDCPPGMGRWLVIRRLADDGAELAYFIAYGPEHTTCTELVWVCRIRWVIEECFAQAKGEVGLDQYEVRTWVAWHRFITLCLLAHAMLVVVRAHAAGDEANAKKGIVRLT